MPRRPRTIATVNRRHPLNVGRVSWWLTLPHLAGTATWYDIMGSNHGALTSMANSSNGWRPTTRPGGWGSMLFDGSAGNIATPVPFNFQDNAPFSVAAWAKTTSGSGTIFSTFAYQGYAGVIFLIGSTITGDLAVVVSDSNFSGRFVYGYNGGVNDGKWHRLGFSYSGAQAASGISIYVDGKSIGASVRENSNPGTLANTNAYIGRSGGGSLPIFFPGYLDDIPIWSRALSPAEVLADYQLSMMGYPGVLNFREVRGYESAVAPAYAGYNMMFGA